jgi:hypothetical protein
VQQCGVAAGGGIDHISLDNWRWVIDVNLMGVLHGIKSFLPHIRAHGEGGHIVNTASMAGCRPDWDSAPTGRASLPWSACRRAFAISSSPSASASACCVRVLSALVSARVGNRPGRYGQSQPLDPASPAAAMVAEIARQIGAGLDPDAVAARVLAAIRDDELYIFTHPGMRAEVEARFAAILAAMDGVSPP